MPEIILTDKNFEEEVIKSPEPVLVDFWASWCGPCQAQAPIIEELAKEFEAKLLKIGKLNVDDNSETAEKYEVMSIPSLILFKDGKIVERLTGLQAKEVLKEKLNDLLK